MVRDVGKLYLPNANRSSVQNLPETLRLAHAPDRSSMQATSLRIHHTNIMRTLMAVSWRQVHRDHLFCFVFFHPYLFLTCRIREVCFIPTRRTGQVLLLEGLAQVLWPHGLLVLVPWSPGALVPWSLGPYVLVL